MKLASSAGDDFCLHQSAKCESKCENRAEGNRTDGEHLDLELVLFFFFSSQFVPETVKRATWSSSSSSWSIVKSHRLSV